MDIARQATPEPIVPERKGGCIGARPARSSGLNDADAVSAEAIQNVFARREGKRMSKSGLSKNVFVTLFGVGLRLAGVGVLLVISGVGAPAAAEDSSLKQEARQAGHAVGSAVRELGHGAKKIGKEIGHGARDAGKAVGTAAKEGGREFHRAIKGEP
jgi:hypothetical protein